MADNTCQKRPAGVEWRQQAGRPGPFLQKTEVWTGMEQALYQNYLEILKSELIPALGCTEPIAIAYAAAVARRALGQEPERIEVACSGNIIKNVRAVIVPNSGGRRGVEVAAILGALVGDPSRELAVLEGVDDAMRTRAAQLLAEQSCSVSLLESGENLHILVTLHAGGHTAAAETKGTHLHIVRVSRDGQEQFSGRELAKQSVDKSRLNLRDILEFAGTVRMEDVSETIGRQVRLNSAISAEGLKHPYGAQVGRILMQTGGADDIRVRVKAAAAAGSDARMSGCTMPVVINSGSGNQGITVCMPVVERARQTGADEERLFRALVAANLTALLQKRCIGSLSAFCGAVCAAAGAGCGMAYLDGYGYDVISMTVSNTLATVGGIVCDGAKASCAAKIAAAVDAALLSYEMAKQGVCFQPGEGLVGENVEQTIESVGRVGRVGMAPTDQEILHIMLEQPGC